MMARSDLRETVLPDFEVRPMSPLIGATIVTGELGQASDSTVKRLRDAVHEHQVVFLPAQHLFDDDLLAFALRLGQPVPHPTTSFREEPPVATFEITLERPPRADVWHTDVPYLAEPPAYGLLSNMIAPLAGGDTIFSSSYESYESLSPALRAFCDGLRSIYSTGQELRDYALREGGQDALRLIDAHCGTRHQPLVIRNPYSGRRALFMSFSYLDGIAGLTESESDAILELLRAPYSNPNFQARWHWTAGDLCIWDQRAVNHRGLSDHFPAHPHRKMQSLFIGDGIPIDTLAVG
jgi:alpha-ketoglutarate-dependent taurine dioxygenase